ncbi:GIY-YIG nuclease family protein [Streptomyces sp. B21-083]|uniref:GIY-YIG nuclease family protein n=1 Tax=Streptomyces sp. B21-083 TaxID=3039410 RepID=UPI002FF36F50
MIEGIPEDLATSMSATFQHIGLIQAKEDRLAEARWDALRQVLHRIGAEYRAGAITYTQLCGVLTAVRATKQQGAMRLWDDIVGVPWQRLAQYGKRLPNGPEGSWVGDYPIPADAPMPIYGVPVVYVLFDEANAPCYVGSTDKLSPRLTAHAKNGKHFVRWQAHLCDDRDHAYRLEDRLLRQHKPYLNRKASR